MAKEREKNKRNISDLAGTWKMNAKEAEEFIENLKND